MNTTKTGAKKILVTGGCGYIGSHTLVDLIGYGYEVVSCDSFANSDPSVLDGIEAITGRRVQNIACDLSDRSAVAGMWREIGHVDGIIHFAAFKSVGESVQEPLKYYSNNINSLLYLLESAPANGVRYFIFSSSCSVYGNPVELPVNEQTPLSRAESPYAYTKQIGEQMIGDYARAGGEMKFVLLRYFNPAGAHPSALIGESSVNPASNLVPVITEAAIGRRPGLTVFGDDYPTRDGTCIRDYIHVMDLARAHTCALNYQIMHPGAPQVDLFNLGIGEGVTVLEAVRAFEKTTGQPFNYHLGPRRPGDVTAVYANADRAREVLGWTPQYGIEDIMSSAWAWEQRRSALIDC